MMTEVSKSIKDTLWRVYLGGERQQRKDQQLEREEGKEERNFHCFSYMKKEKKDKNKISLSIL